jgi:hypothetical protein
MSTVFENPKRAERRVFFFDFFFRKLSPTDWFNPYQRGNLRSWQFGLNFVLMRSITLE